MTTSERDEIREIMEVLEGAPCGAIGAKGMTLAEMRECWESGHSAEDDAMYDVCQHAWRRLQALMEGKA